MVKSISIVFRFCILLSFFVYSYAADNKYRKTECHVEGNYYKVLGNFIEIDNMKVYETDNRSTGRVIIVGYDVGGFVNNNNIQQVADKIADCYGFKVVIPDFFHGTGVNLTNFTPAMLPEIYAFVAKHGNWSKSVKGDFLNVMKHYKISEGINEFGVMGFCWGGYMSKEASIDFPELKAAGLVHPALIFTEDAEKVQVPMFLLPSKDEPDLQTFFKILQRKFGSNSGLKVFHDMSHGFAGAQGNFSNPLNKDGVDQVLQILGNFFDNNFS